MLLQSSRLPGSPVPGAGVEPAPVGGKSRLVPAGVAAGRSVSLIQVPTAGGGHTGGGGVLVDRALVVAVRTDPTGGTTVLSVEVPASLAPTVAQSVAAGALAVTLLP